MTNLELNPIAVGNENSCTPFADTQSLTPNSNVVPTPITGSRNLNPMFDEEIFAVRKCQLCQKEKLPFIVLRQCAHACCIECTQNQIAHILTAKKEEVSISCPLVNSGDDKMKCTELMHPNDIRSALAHILLLERRTALLAKYDANCILKAFGGREFVHPCPKCSELYTEEPGCHYVRCTKKDCQTYFCWQCGDRCDTYMHFLNDDGCSFSWQDIQKVTGQLSFTCAATSTSIVHFYYDAIFFYTAFYHRTILYSLPRNDVHSSNVDRYAHIQKWHKQCSSIFRNCDIRNIGFSDRTEHCHSFNSSKQIAQLILLTWLFFIIFFNPCCPSAAAVRILLTQSNKFLQLFIGTDMAKLIRDSIESERNADIYLSNLDERETKLCKFKQRRRPALIFIDDERQSDSEDTENDQEMKNEDIAISSV